MKKVVLLSTIVSLVVAKSVAAKNYDDRYYIAPSLTYIVADDDRKTPDDNVGIGIGIGKVVSEKFNLELRAFYNLLDKTDSNFPNVNYRWNLYGSTFEGQYFFYRDKLSPYFAFGAGFAKSKVLSKSAIGVVTEAGLGFTYQINDNVAFRSDARWRYNNNFNNHLTHNNADEYNDLVINAGVVIPFGAASSSSNVVKKQAETTVADAEKSSNCINPDCSLSMKFSDTNFEAGSFSLNQKTKGSLRNLAEHLKNNPREKLIVEGHASTDGAAKFNYDLSRKRAKTVAAYLSSLGVKNSMAIKWYGETRTLVDDTKSLKAKKINRRVEVK